MSWLEKTARKRGLVLAQEEYRYEDLGWMRGRPGDWFRHKGKVWLCVAPGGWIQGRYDGQDSG